MHANNLQTRKSGNLTQFDPAKVAMNDAALSAAIKYATQIKDWPALELTVAEKIEQQREFVAWWEKTVSVSHGAGRGNKKNADRGSFSAAEAEESTGISQQQVSKWRKKLSNPDAYRDKLYGVAYKAAMGEDHNHRAQGTGENEWYTPEKYLELAREVLGEIDLDPASSIVAQKTVQAKKFFDRTINGLRQEWHGRVWLNPPYSQPLIGEFVEKMVEERCAERVTGAIMLTHNYTDTSWFHKATEIADAICFTRGRIKFLDSQGGDCAPTQGQAFFYFGPHAELFAEKFVSVGFVTTPFQGEVANDS